MTTMGCGSSHSVKTFYHETLREQDTVSSICERGEPEGEAGTDKCSKEKATAVTNSVPHKKSETKSIPYVPVDDYDMPTEFSISEISDVTVKPLTLIDRRELLMQEEDIM